MWWGGVRHKMVSHEGLCVYVRPFNELGLCSGIIPFIIIVVGGQHGIKKTMEKSAIAHEKEKKKRKKHKKNSHLLVPPALLPHILLLIHQPAQHALHDSLLLLELLHLETLAAAARLLLQGLQVLLHKLDILDPQLVVDDLEITHGVDIALDVDDLGVVEAAHHLEDGVDGTDVRQERVSETGTGRGAAGQAGNVVDREVGGYL